MEYLGMRTKRSKRGNCRFTQDEESPGLISKQLQIASLKSLFVDVEWQSINQINNLSQPRSQLEVLFEPSSKKEN